MLDEDKRAGSGADDIPLISMGSDIRQMAKNVGNGTVGGLLLSFILIAAALGVGFLAELGTRRFTAEFSKQFKEQAIPDLDGPMRFIAGVMRSIPTFIHILVYCVAALVLFQILPGSESGGRRYLFLALLFSIVFFRIINQLSLIVSAPKTPELRVLPKIGRASCRERVFRAV